MTTEANINEGELNVVFFTQEEIVLIQRLADELARAVSGMNEVVAQTKSLNSKMSEINRRLDEPIQRVC